MKSLLFNIITLFLILSCSTFKIGMPLKNAAIGKMNVTANIQYIIKEQEFQIENCSNKKIILNDNEEQNDEKYFLNNVGSANNKEIIFTVAHYFKNKAGSIITLRPASTNKCQIYIGTVVHPHVQGAFKVKANYCNSPDVDSYFYNCKELIGKADNTIDAFSIFFSKVSNLKLKKNNASNFFAYDPDYDFLLNEYFEKSKMTFKKDGTRNYNNSNLLLLNDYINSSGVSVIFKNLNYLCPVK